MPQAADGRLLGTLGSISKFTPCNCACHALTEPHKSSISSIEGTGTKLCTMLSAFACGQIKFYHIDRHKTKASKVLRASWVFRSKLCSWTGQRSIAIARTAAVQCASPPCAERAGDESLEAQRREAEAGIASLQQRRQPTKVSQKKVDQVKVPFSMLIPLAACSFLTLLRHACCWLHICSQSLKTSECMVPSIRILYSGHFLIWLKCL